jgi:hypothetical protein
MRRGADPCLLFILAHLEHASARLDLRPGAPSRYEGASECRIREGDREGVIPRVPEGVIAHPSAPQFSSSQTVICVCRWPRPSGGTPIRMRTGKRRSANMIISGGLPGIVFLVCSD